MIFDGVPLQSGHSQVTLGSPWVMASTVCSCCLWPSEGTSGLAACPWRLLQTLSERRVWAALLPLLLHCSSSPASSRKGASVLLELVAFSWRKLTDTSFQRGELFGFWHLFSTLWQSLWKAARSFFCEGGGLYFNIHVKVWRPVRLACPGSTVSQGQCQGWGALRNTCFCFVFEKTQTLAVFEVRSSYRC